MNEPVVEAPTTVSTPSVVVPVIDTSYMAPAASPSITTEFAEPSRVVFEAFAAVAVLAHHETSIVVGAGLRAGHVTRTLVSLAWEMVKAEGLPGVRRVPRACSALSKPGLS
jgi:hypothetical protein